MNAPAPVVESVQGCIPRMLAGRTQEVVGLSQFHNLRVTLEFYATPEAGASVGKGLMLRAARRVPHGESTQADEQYSGHYVVMPVGSLNAAHSDHVTAFAQLDLDGLDGFELFNDSSTSLAEIRWAVRVFSQPVVQMQPPSAW